MSLFMTVIWREQELVVTRVYMDEEFLVNAIAKVTHGVLPEHLGKCILKLFVYP